MNKPFVGKLENPATRRGEVVALPGENGSGDIPVSVDSQGMSIYGLRIGAVMGGSSIIDHRSSIVALGGAFLLAQFEAYQVRLQTEVGPLVPGEVFLIAPYVLSIIALIVAARSADYSRALLVLWFKGRR